MIQYGAGKPNVVIFSRRALMKYKLCLVIGILAVLAAIPLHGAETWRDYFKDGIHYFNVGDYSKATECLQVALEMNPPGEELKAAKDAVGPVFWSKLLDNPETRAVGYRLLKYVYKYLQEKRKETEYIKALAETLVSSETDFQTRWETVHKIVAVGQFACPVLIDYLGVERNEDARKAVRMALENLSYRAVLPLIEALNADTSTQKGLLTKQNARQRE